jgi:hypothetical protein
MRANGGLELAITSKSEYVEPVLVRAASPSESMGARTPSALSVPDRASVLTTPTVTDAASQLPPNVMPLESVTKSVKPAP